MNVKFFHLLFIGAIVSWLPILARDCDGKDVFLEFRAGGFIPTGCDFRNIYGFGTYFVSPEFSWQVVEHHNWYIFLSAGYAAKNGNSIGFCTPTEARLIPLGIGLKYFFQSRNSDICKNNKFYLGLGFQPVLLKTHNCSQFVRQDTSNWGMGGIAKFGWMCTFGRNFFIDIFADYSFVNVGCGNVCCSSSCSSSCSSTTCFITNASDAVIPLKADISGAILGIGLGYSF